MADNNRNQSNDYNNYGSAGAYNTSFGSQYGRDYEDRSRGAYEGSIGSDYGSLYGTNYGASFHPDYRSLDRESDSRRRIGDMKTGGGNRGKGPKGYRRSEERIREDAYERLTDDDRVDASNIEVEVQGDDLILAGIVNSREEKRRAVDVVESISGIRNVENRIRVRRSDESNTGISIGNTGGREAASDERGSR